MHESTLIPDRFLATKFLVPTASQALVDRPRLHLRLNQGLQRKLTLVSAPAGFGKTTLVSSWLQSLPDGNPVVAWLSLDAHDNTAPQFWDYVLTAVDRSSPGVGRQALASLHAPEAPPLTFVLTTLINDLMALPMPVVIILDNYHLITDPTIYRSLFFLLEHLPHHVHLMLLTRSDPPLPLARLRASGHIVEVRSDELRCTIDEMKIFLDQVMCVRLGDGDVLGEIATRTEGWLAGLHLLGLSLQSRSDPATVLAEIRGSHHYILDYLTEEVLRQQPADVQRFLLHTSILDRLSASLCNAVLERTPDHLPPTAELSGVDQTVVGRSSQELLEYLERANLFVMPLDLQRRWYRYHGLFAEALRFRLQAASPQDVRALHHRASVWYADHDCMDDAVQHALHAEEWQWAADLIEKFLLTPAWERTEPEMAMVHRWLERLPDEVIRERRRICLAYAHPLFATAPHSKIDGFLHGLRAPLAAALSSRAVGEPALPSVARDEHENLLGEIVAHRACVDLYLGDGRATLPLCEQALAHLSPGNYAARADVAFVQSTAHYTQGDVHAAYQHMVDAVELAQTLGNVPITIRFMSHAAYYLVLQGRMRQALELAQKAIERGTGPSGQRYGELCWALSVQADVLCEWSRLDEALDLALQAIQLSHQIGSAAFAYQGYTVLARVYRARGELEAARAAITQLSQVPSSLSWARTIFSTVEQVQLWLACEDQEQTVRWANSLDHTARPQLALAWERQELARLHALLALKQPHDLLTRLEPLLASAQAGSRWRDVIELLVVRALAHQMCGEGDRAATSLADALRLAEPEGFRRTFVDHGAPIADLLVRLPDASHETKRASYIHALLAALPTTIDLGSRAEPPTMHTVIQRYSEETDEVALVEPLSARELEILGLIAAGASNQVIADELILALNTVKRHTSNILGKLGASNRTQAVAQARMFGMLSDERLTRHFTGQSWSLPRSLAHQAA